VHLVPYSEHSSYEELREYVRFLKPHQVRLGITVESNLNVRLHFVLSVLFHDLLGPS
jgi:DNA ligase-1